MPRLRFAGQITGVEGYIESAACGLLAGRFAAAERLQRDVVAPPRTTALGAILDHITGGHLIEEVSEVLSPTSETSAPEMVLDVQPQTPRPSKPRSFQPMNVNFGVFPPMDTPATSLDGKKLKGPERGAARKRLMSARALRDVDVWLRAQQSADRD